MKRRFLGFAGLATVTAAAMFAFFHGRSYWVPIYQKLSGRRTVADVVRRYGPISEERLVPFFQRAKVEYPPRAVSLLGFKEEMRLELWAEARGRQVLVKTYEVKRISGGPGPKLKEGDGQVPEGIYRIEGLNPNSSYHLSMKLNYPNEFDRRQASAEGRTNLGGDIFIHGKAVSIGCLAMGDEAIEELFVLASRVDKDNVSVVLAPRDFRKKPLAVNAGPPVWINTLYLMLDTELRRYGP